MILCAAKCECNVGDRDEVDTKAEGEGKLFKWEESTDEFVLCCVSEGLEIEALFLVTMLVGGVGTDLRRF